MTKKDYVVIATALVNSLPKNLLVDNSQANRERHSQWHKIVNSFCLELSKENPNFDESKFYRFMKIFIEVK